MDHKSSHSALHPQLNDLKTINPNLLTIPNEYPSAWLLGTTPVIDQESDVHRHTARRRSDIISQLDDEVTHLLDCPVPNVSTSLWKCALAINQ
jgi:hypothetical protein